MSMEANNGTLPQDGSIKRAVSKDNEKREKGDLKQLEKEKTGVSPTRWWVLVLFSLLGSFTLLIIMEHIDKSQQLGGCSSYSPFLACFSACSGILGGQ